MKFSLYLASALVLTLTGTSARPAIKGARSFAANNGGEQQGQYGSVPQAVHNAEQLPQQNAAADVSATVKESNYLLTVTVPLAEVSSSVVLQELVANMHITNGVSTALVPVVTSVASAANVEPVQPVKSASPVAVIEAKPSSDKPIQMDGLPTLIPGDMARKMEEVLPVAASASLSGKTVATSTITSSKTQGLPTFNFGFLPVASTFDFNGLFNPAPKPTSTSPSKSTSDLSTSMNPSSKPTTTSTATPTFDVNGLLNPTTKSTVAASATASSTTSTFDFNAFVSAVLNHPTSTATGSSTIASPTTSTFDLNAFVSAVFHPPTKTTTSKATSPTFDFEGLISAIFNPPTKTSTTAHPTSTGSPFGFDIRKFLKDLEDFIEKLLEFIDKFTHDHLSDGKKIDTFNVMEKSKQPNLVYTFKLFRAIINDSQASLHAITSKETITFQDVQALVMSTHKSLNEVRHLQQEYEKSMGGKKSEIDLTAVTFLDPIEIEKALKANEKVDISRITMSSDLFLEYTEQFVQKAQTLLESLSKVISSGPVTDVDVQAVATPTAEVGSSKSTPKPAEAVQEIPPQSNFVAVIASEDNFEEFDNIVNDATITVMAMTAEATSH
ncbi:hypothetical protein K450DRAFT_195860 [Umbelopsis ramanniana AG]|uniref:Uncharacterized protein n=1 Tax=Umbelopsis ramanniana AG TaxID=1314678 RepID=A0AAD5EIB7_UMBRA|nr:uncharacterized protein K450DRAFT_195860 [Umbelopsis ramanniana AG]KAI8583565.1 hypothetical protein K450DRAFT_195860 [Umbelopsis ramanniana AG]